MRIGLVVGYLDQLRGGAERGELASCLSGPRVSEEACSLQGALACPASEVLKTKLTRTTIAAWFATASRRIAIALGFAIPVSRSLTQILLVALFIGWLASGDWAVKLRRIRQNRVALCAVAMFAVYAISLTYSTVGLREAADALLSYRKYLYVPILVTVFADAPTRKYGIRAFALAMLITLAASFLMSWGLLESTKGTATDCAFFKNHIVQSTLMAFFVALLVNRVFTVSRWRWVCIVIIMLAVYNILFLVAGRTGYLVLFALICLLSFQRRGTYGLVAALLLTSCLAAAAYTCSDRFRSRIDLANQEVADYFHWQENLNHSSIGLRLAFYRTSLSIAREHPLFGTGVGSFSEQFEKFNRSQGYAVVKHRYGTPHNEFFNVLVQTGILGVAILLYWLYVQWELSKRLDPKLAPLAQAILVLFVVGGFFNSMGPGTIEGNLCCYFIAICAAGLACAPPEPHNKPAHPEQAPADQPVQMAT